MFTFVEPAQSAVEHERLLAIEEEMPAPSGTPTVVNIAVHDLTEPRPPRRSTSRRGRRAKYRELTSCSNTTDFQARRLDVRYWPGDEGARQAPHTLNGTPAVAVGRTIIALAENGQRDDGVISHPVVLHEYGVRRGDSARGESGCAKVHWRMVRHRHHGGPDWRRRLARGRTAW